MTDEHTARSCERCGTPLEAGLSACPRCLLELGLVEARPTGESPIPPPRAANAGPPPTLEEVRAAFPGLEVEALLGQGGMGTVFRARQPRLDRRVALKILPRSLGTDPAFAERFAREARALARLVHPGIVAVHEFGCQDGLHYLMMELVEGVNLREHLREGPLEPRHALAIARQLCEGLQFAHDEGVVHRDIKPENVLVDARGRVKVADFGLAKLVGSPEDLLTHSDQVMGTPHYMAPEQLERPLEVDHRADLFALGVVLYEMLTGSLPRGKFEAPSRRVRVDVQFDHIVLKALEREPTRRYQHALEIRSDVERMSLDVAPEHEPQRESEASAGPDTAARRDPRSSLEHGSRSLAVLVAGWLALGSAWNAGLLALVSAVFLFAAALLWLVHAAVRADGQWIEALGRTSVQERVERRVVSAMAVVIGLLLIVIGHVVHWERGGHAWRPILAGAHGLYESYARDPWALLRLAAGDSLSRIVAEDEQPRVVMKSSVTSVPLDQPAEWSWVLMSAGFLLLAAGLALAARTPGRRDLAVRAWKLGGSLSATAAAALALLWIGMPVIARRPHEVLQEVALSCKTTASLEEAHERLRSALEVRGLRLEIEQLLGVVDERFDHELGSALVLRGSNPDPFERWHTSATGPVRTSPQVWVLVVPQSEGGGCRLVLRAGQYDPRTPHLDAAHETLLQVSREVEG